MNEPPTLEAPEATALPTQVAAVPTTEPPPTQTLEEPTTAPPTLEEGEATEPSSSTEIEPTEALTDAPTEAPTDVSTDAPEQTAEATAVVSADGLTPVSANADWTPVEQDFDGIVMVLVPAGCFSMGREGVSGAEAPEHEQCFDKPFWIDKTEITNAQFALYENVAELLSTNRRAAAPRDSISQREAATFCAMREGRLPTEREWEYAASGPSNLVYPWGDEWVGGYAVWERTSRDRSELAGSRPQNTSWVGAIDMSGNLWEWTSTIDRSYPYDAGDGREESSVAGSPRIIRGGSWANQPPSLTTSFRLGSIPTARDAKIGFRCVRDTA